MCGGPDDNVDLDNSSGDSGGLAVDTFCDKDDENLNRDSLPFVGDNDLGDRPVGVVTCSDFLSFFNATSSFCTSRGGEDDFIATVSPLSRCISTHMQNIAHTGIEPKDIVISHFDSFRNGIFWFLHRLTQEL